jgi:hypothetical protein
MTRHPEVDYTEERLTLPDMKMYRAYRLVYRSREGSLVQLIGLPVRWHRSRDGLTFIFRLSDGEKPHEAAISADAIKRATITHLKLYEPHGSMKGACG